MSSSAMPVCAELAHPVGLVDAALGDVDGGGPARADFEVGHACGDGVAERVLLGARGVPRHFASTGAV
jgi:hypothetical protein